LNITEDLVFRAELLKRIADREFSERTGVHQSDLVYCLNKQALRRKAGEQSTDMEILIFSLGWATQRWLTGQDQDEPEKEVDGIKVTCDALAADAIAEEGDGYAIYDIGKAVPWELKCTFQSSSKAIEENPHWVRQLMAQCYVQRSLVAYLSRLELMGNWKSIFGKKEEKQLPENEKPTLHAYKLTFTQDELDRNWAWLRERKELYLRIIETGELLPKAIALPSGQDWECLYCKFTAECEGG